MAHPRRATLHSAKLALALGVVVACGTTYASNAAGGLARPRALHAEIKVVPARAFVGQLVTVDLSHSVLSAGRTLLHATVSWGDRTKSATLASLRAHLTHRYGKAGRYRIVATVEDSSRHTSSAAFVESVTTLIQHAYWTLFNGGGSSFMLESTVLPLSSKSHDIEIAGTVANRLVCTSGVATDPKGRLWVISYPTGCHAPDAAEIDVFNVPVTGSSSASLTFTLPSTGDYDNLAFDSRGDLWVEDDYSHVVEEFKGPFSSSGPLTPSLTLATGTVRPSGLAVDAKGNLYVANGASKQSHSIAVYRAPVTSSSVPTFLGGLTSPGGLLFDTQGDLYASTNPSSGNGAAIVRYSAKDLARRALPSIVDAHGQHGAPYASNFAWDAWGNLYVADCGSSPHIAMYPLSSQPFSKALGPSAVYSNASLTAIGCAWGIAIH